MMQKNERHNGFVVLDTEPLPEYGGTGIWLRHEATALTVVHLHNADAENFFSFTFKTPPPDNSGVAHVTEHCVFCGSKRFPYGDMFERLEDETVNTSINAYTAFDHTVFYASSIVQTDFFNLLAAFSDAVFFPLLKQEAFLQEGHRLEYDAAGIPHIKGVVYNEMKGNYSSFERVVSEAITHSVLGGARHTFDSGGDPLEIPFLTVQEVRRFHKTYYVPENCLLFLYGNIDTKELLAFLERTFLADFCKGSNGTSVLQKIKTKRLVHTLPPFKKSVLLYAPAQEDSKRGSLCSVSVAWKIALCTKPFAQTALEVLFLGDLLWGDDCAPVAKALLESGLGSDIAPQTGETLLLMEPFLSCGLRGVKKSDAQKVQTVLFATLADVCKRGIDANDIERTCTAFHFSHREQLRFEGPCALVLLRRCLRAWFFNESPWRHVHVRNEFSALEARIKKQPSYVSELIATHLLNNDTCTLVTVVPSKREWNKKREEKEREVMQKKCAEHSVAYYKAQEKKVRAFQAQDAAATRLFLQHSRERVFFKSAPIQTAVSSLCGVPLFTNTEPTNGIVYVDVAFAADTLPPKEYPLLPAFTECLFQVGRKNMAWGEALSHIKTVTGGMGAYTRTAQVLSRSSARTKPYRGRDWVVLHFKALEENVREAFLLLQSFLLQTDFSDTARLSALLTSQAHAAASMVVPYAHWYALRRASCFVNRTLAIEEIWEGLSAFFTAQRLASLSVQTVAERFRRILRLLKKGGAVVHITGTNEGIAAAKQELPLFIKELSLTAPKERVPSCDADFFALARLGNQKKSAVQKSAYKKSVDFIDEVFIAPETVGNLAFCFPSAPFSSKNSLADTVYTHLLSNTALWKKIRTLGSSYGVFFTAKTDSALSRFITLRDPSPFESLSVMKKTLASLKNEQFSAEEVENAVLSCYTDALLPQTPQERGASGFLWELYGFSYTLQEARNAQLLSITAQDIQKASVRYAKNSATGKGRSVIICGEKMISAKNKESTGIIIKLPI